MNSHESRKLRQQKLLADRKDNEPIQKNSKAKPGTSQSIQIIKARPEKKSKHQIATERMLATDYLDTGGIVDESIVLFPVEFGLLKKMHIDELPKDTMELCEKFEIILTNMPIPIEKRRRRKK